MRPISRMLSSILLLSSIATPIIALEGMKLAERAPQAISYRATFGGGWPLALDGSGLTSCPDSAPVSCGSNQQCCGQGQTCKGSSIEQYCCPTDTDCATYVDNFPVCINTTWTMYKCDFGMFCCPSDQIAVTPNGGYFGLCVANDQVVPASLSASKVAQNTAAASVNPSSTPSTTPPSSTPTQTGTSPSGDDSLTSTPSGSSNPTGTSKITGTGTSSNPANTAAGSGSGSTNTQKSSNNGLSLGAIIGLAIGGVALLLLAGILYALMRRNSLRKASMNSHPPGPMYMPTPQQQSGPGIYEVNTSPIVGRKPVPHIMATSMYSAAPPGQSPSPGAFSSPPLYSDGPNRSQTASPAGAGVGRYDSVSTSAGTQQPYDPPPASANDTYANYHEMEGPGVVNRAELRADRTGN